MVYADPPTRARFRVLLTEDRERGGEHWTRQLPRLLEPQGVEAFLARTGREALEVVSERTFHAALVDLATPTGEQTATGNPGGLWLLELFRRLPERPPIVVVHSRGASPRELHRFLNQALRLGAFSVINRPTDLAPLLSAIQRMLDRQYQGQWPSDPPPPQTNPPRAHRSDDPPGSPPDTGTGPGA